MLRVAVLLEQVLGPVPGGTGRYAREVATALAEQAPPDAEVSSWTAWHRDVAAAIVPGVAGPHRLPAAAPAADPGLGARAAGRGRAGSTCCTRRRRWPRRAGARPWS